MTALRTETLLHFLEDPRHKQIRALIELAANGNEDAISYIEFISEEINRKFSIVDGMSNDALNPKRLNLKIDHTKGGQEMIKAVNNSLQYHFNEYGKLVSFTKNNQNISSPSTPVPMPAITEEKTDAKTETNPYKKILATSPKIQPPRKSININFNEFDLLSKSITSYTFYLLVNDYKFRFKCVGKKMSKKKKTKKVVNKKKAKILTSIGTEFDFKTILFSPKFEQCDCIVVIIPPHRAGITYMSLCVDEGLAYGSFLPFIEQILSQNPVKKKKKNLSVDGNSNTSAAGGWSGSGSGKVQHRWGIMLLDPLGKDDNHNKYSIIKIFDKWLSKRIPALNIFGLPVKNTTVAGGGGGHRRDDSDESIASMISTTGGQRKNKAVITNLFYVGGLDNGELISHLLHRRGKEMEKVTKGICMLGCQDPYDVNDVTRVIYKRCARNWMNSSLKVDTAIDGIKLNGDPYIIDRVSAGNARFCCTSASDSVFKFIQERVDKEICDEEVVVETNS